MFKSIQEGLDVFKKELREHLEKTNEVADREKKDRKEKGLDYRGISEWTEGEYEAYFERTHQLEGMGKVLGLSKPEFAYFWKETEKKLGIRQEEGAEGKKEQKKES